jgi:hypothetical protein
MRENYLISICGMFIDDEHDINFNAIDVPRMVINTSDIYYIIELQGSRIKRSSEFETDIINDSVFQVLHMRNGRKILLWDRRDDEDIFSSLEGRGIVMRISS